MAQVYCKYHPTDPARWFCPACQINYCRSCMPSELGKPDPRCTICKETLQSVGTGNAITPFWIRSGKFFLYPLHFYPLVFLILLTVLNSLLDHNLFGLLLHLVITIVFMKYAYAVLDDTSRGQLKPLPINSKVINNGLELPIKQMLLTFAIVSANIAILREFGSSVAIVSVSLSIFAFPANVMVLAMERSFFAAFNPFIILGFIRRIGAAYLLLSLFLLFLTSASGKMMQLLYETTDQTSFIAISAFVNMYFMLIMYHLMGYILFQYHEALGQTIDEDFNDTPKKSNMPSKAAFNPELREFEILMQEGKTEEANNKIQQIIRENPTDHNARMLDLKLQNLIGDTDNYKKHAEKYINYLFEQENMNDAVKVLNTVLLNIPDFKPKSASQRLCFAKMMQQNSQNKAAVRLINNLHIDFPEFKKIPEAYLLASKILCESLAQDKQAKAILEFLLKKYPKSEQHEEIEKYLYVVNNLSAL